MSKIIKFILISLISIIVVVNTVFLISELNKQGEEFHRSVEIITPIDHTYNSHKSYIRTNFILVIQDIETGRKFDITVTPTTWATCKIGDKTGFVFTRRELIRHGIFEDDTYLDPTLHMMLSIILIIIGITRIVLIYNYGKN